MPTSLCAVSSTPGFTPSFLPSSIIVYISIAYSYMRRPCILTSKHSLCLFQNMLYINWGEGGFDELKITKLLTMVVDERGVIELKTLIKALMLRPLPTK